MFKHSDKHKAFFWHIHKTGGSYVEHVLERYYNFGINMAEVEDEKIEKKEFIIDNDDDLENIMKELVDEMEENKIKKKNRSKELWEKNTMIKKKLESIKGDIDWKEKRWTILAEDSKKKKEELVNVEEFKIKVDDEEEEQDVLLFDWNNEKELEKRKEKQKKNSKKWNKKDDEQKGGLAGAIENRMREKLASYMQIPLEKWQTYFKSCIVRNPYDRAISSYEFLTQRYGDRRGHPDLDKKECDFKYFFKNEERLNSNGYMHFHAYASQSQNIRDSKYGIKMDFIGKYENLEWDLMEILKKIGITKFPHLKMVKNNIHINKSKKNTITSYYDEETLKIVNELFKEDFEQFDYPMFENVNDLNEYLLELRDEEKNKNSLKKLLDEYYLDEYDTYEESFIDEFMMSSEQKKFRFKKDKMEYALKKEEKIEEIKNKKKEKGIDEKVEEGDHINIILNRDHAEGEFPVCKKKEEEEKKEEEDDEDNKEEEKDTGFIYFNKTCLDCGEVHDDEDEEEEKEGKEKEEEKEGKEKEEENKDKEVNEKD